MKHALLSTFAVVCLATSAFANPAWKQYVNARFGFLFSRPSELIASREPDNGGGMEFHTKDSEFSVAASGHFLIDGDNLEKNWNSELAELGATVTYKHKAANWYVISGVKGGTEYYHKACVNGDNAVELHITYPHAKNKQYDPWVEKIEKSLVPFLKGDYDRVEKQ